MAAAVIIKSDERRERQGQILRDFGHDPRTAGREAREQAEALVAQAREAVERASGAPVGIKWLNDLYLNGKKLCGILTELSFLGESGEPDYVVAGMGINMNQTAETFQAQGLGDIATSLALEGFPVERNHLAVCLLSALEQMTRDFPDRRADYLADYRAHCVTLGRRVSFEGPEGTRTGTASGVDGSFALLVSGDDGREHTVNSGTVTML